MLMVSQPSKGFLLLAAALAFVSACAASAQNVPPKTGEIKLTGIVLAADHRCSAPHKSDGLCRRSDWALASGRQTYLLYGDIPTLEKFERKRVNISGLLQEEPIIVYGTHMIRRQITVHSIEIDEPSEQAIEALVKPLQAVPWRWPENHCSPMCWQFAFTDPMIQVLQAGSAAQDVLLRHLGDPAIQDQVVMLLGGVGNEKSIWPIIETLTDGADTASDARAKRLNLIGNLALTNLTVSGVIWHHGGGISPDLCPVTPKSCWSKWWLDQKDSFRVGVGGDRLYSNYPNYGIYAQFDDVTFP
jgi:hypothetical protein